MLTRNVVELVDPNPVRDWLYVEHHVNAYLTCLGNPKAIGHVFNFCTGKGHTVKETVNKIAELIEFKGEIKWSSAPQRPVESKVIIGSYEKAKQMLGWEPKYGLEEGLKETIAFWRNKLRK